MFNGLTAEVTISGGLEIDKQTPAWATASQTNAGTATIGTVPVGKKWSIISAQLSARCSAVTITCDLELNAVDVIVLVCSSATEPANQANSISWDYSACPILTAGQTATVTNSGNGGSSHGCICYVEDNA